MRAPVASQRGSNPSTEQHACDSHATTTDARHARGCPLRGTATEPHRLRVCGSVRTGAQVAVWVPVVMSRGKDPGIDATRPWPRTTTEPPRTATHARPPRPAHQVSPPVRERARCANTSEACSRAPAALCAAARYAAATRAGGRSPPLVSSRTAGGRCPAWPRLRRCQERQRGFPLRTCSRRNRCTSRCGVRGRQMAAHPAVRSSSSRLSISALMSWEAGSLAVLTCCSCRRRSDS